MSLRKESFLALFGDVSHQKYADNATSETNSQSRFKAQG